MSKKTGSNNPSSADNNYQPLTSPVDRRRFVKTVLASLPAASLACALPAAARGSSTAKYEDYVCLVEWLFEMGGIHFYLALNCTTQETSIYVGEAGLSLGNCDEPEATNCVPFHLWNGNRRTNDALNIVLSPNLDERQLNKVELFRSLMLMNS